MEEYVVGYILWSKTNNTAYRDFCQCATDKSVPTQQLMGFQSGLISAPIGNVLSY